MQNLIVLRIVMTYESSVNSDQTAVFTLLFQNVVANNQILRISTHMHSSLGTTVIFDCFTHLWFYYKTMPRMTL